MTRSLPTDIIGRGTNTPIYYRTRSGGHGKLESQEDPEHRIVWVEHEDGSTAMYQELRTDGPKFNDDFEWIPLGYGLIPTNSYGIRRALFDLSYGYLSGFPIRDILTFVWNFSLSRKRSAKQLNIKTDDENTSPSS